MLGGIIGELRNSLEFGATGVTVSGCDFFGITCMEGEGGIFGGSGFNMGAGIFAECDLGALVPSKTGGNGLSAGQIAENARNAAAMQS